MPKMRSLITAEELERRLVRGEIKLLEAITSIIDEAQRAPMPGMVDSLEAYMWTRDFKRVIKSIGVDRIVERLNAANETAIIDTFKLGAAAAMLPSSVRTEMSFTLTNPHAMNYIATRTRLESLRIREELHDGIRAEIQRAFREGGHPYVIARRIRETLGLSGKDVAAVDNYRTFLDSLDKYMERPLTKEAIKRLKRGGLNQATARAWVRQGLTSERRERLVRSYSARLLRERSETVSRTLVLDSSRAGQEALWDQAIEQGYLKEEQWEKMWSAAKESPRTCEICEAFHGERRPIHGTYPDGSGHEGKHFNCRCREVLVRKQS